MLQENTLDAGLVFFMLFHHPQSECKLSEGEPETIFDTDMSTSISAWHQSKLESLHLRVYSDMLPRSICRQRIHPQVPPLCPGKKKKRSGNPKWRRGYWSLAQILGSAWLHRIEPIGLVCWVPRGTNPLIQDCWGLPELTLLPVLWFGFIMGLDHMMSGISDVEYGISNARVSKLEKYNDKSSCFPHADG
jgi:hypothetical protein